MRVMLSLEIKLIELPDDDPEPAETTRVVADPMDALGKMAGRMLQIGSPTTIYPMPRIPGGLEYRRSATLGCGTFPTLADILDKYDRLTSELEKSWP
jgi:hypothetical protein